MRYKSVRHRDRFAEAIRKKDKKDFRLIAALYLLTSDIRLWNLAKQYVFRTGIDFENIRLPNIHPNGYTLFCCAKDLYLGTNHLPIADLTDCDLIPNKLFGVISNAMGICRYGLIAISDDEEQPIQVKLYADSDIGNRLAVLFNSRHSLEEANLCAYKVENAHPAIREDMKARIINGQYYSPKAVVADIAEMTEGLIAVKVNYYCPLTVYMDDDEYGECIEVGNYYARANEDAVRSQVMKEQARDLNNMAHYFSGSDSAKDKLVSALWDVELVRGELYGVIHTGLRSAFTPEEEQEWIDELTGQAADGFGEGLEQHEIQTDGGGIYVSFWNSGDDYFMENEMDFRKRLSESQSFSSPQIGGM